MSPGKLSILLGTGGAGGGAFLVYALTAAPGYTWAHAGADGGDLLAAAATGGVPHPPGYPLYTLLLEWALHLGAWLAPGMEPARAGNLLSAAFAAGAVALTAYAAMRLLAGRAPMPGRKPGLRRDTIFVAALCGGAFGVTPLLWSQATITEVYSLHALWIAALGLILVRPIGLPALALILAGGLAHHPTILLLWPAALYAWREQTTKTPRGAVDAFKPVSYPAWKWILALLGALLAAGFVYLRIPWAAGLGNAAGAIPPPVLWGYPDNWAGLRWLVSGALYRPFVLGVPWDQVPDRVLSALGYLGTQYTLVGALLMVVGWRGPVLGTRGRVHAPLVALLWVLPTLGYAITYNTTDSYIYLLPIVWIMALWLGVGLEATVHFLGQGPATTAAARYYVARHYVMAAAFLGLLALLAMRWPAHNLHAEQAAQEYISAAATVLTPQSLVITGSDAQTFALWYGAWGSGELTRVAPDLVLVNVELYAQPWYQRLLAARHPDLQAVGAPVSEFVGANAATRSTWLSDPALAGEGARLPGQAVADGVLWRYTTAADVDAPP